VEAGAVVGGKYHVVRQLGAGGMGAVYDAVHAKTGRRVALKLINESALSRGREALARFEREARAAAAVDSLHVVQVLDSGEDEASGLPFLVLEFLEGEDLRAVLRRGPLPPEIAIKIALQIAQGLVRAHANDVIHRDLKPANVFLAQSDGGRQIVKLLDFGIAKIVEPTDEHLTGTNDLIGSPPYMSPEQVKTPLEIDARTDLWSLGVVLYEMLAGAVPTASIKTLAARAHSICYEQAPRLETVDPALADIVQLALAIDRDQRFQTAEGMLAALEAIAPNGPDIFGPTPASSRRAGPLVVAETTTRTKRSRGWLVALLSACAVLAVYLAFRLLERAPEPPPPVVEPPPPVVAAPTPSIELEPEPSATSAPRVRPGRPKPKQHDDGRNRF
jgi:serine/threonine protein kinase